MKKWENGEEKTENCKREGGKIENGRRESSKMRRGAFFFFFLSLLFTFQNDKKLFRVYHNGNFLSGKAFHAGKKIRKNAFAPSQKFSCYAPW